jgi:trimeric autotransporter adhesin
MKKTTLIYNYKKRFIYLFFLLFIGKNSLYAQRVGINTSAPTNDLHVISTADPVRLIGMQTGSNADSIVTINGTGLLKRRNTNTLFNSFAWRLIGNSGTNPTTNFLGTTDAQDLVIKANGVEGLRLKNADNSIDVAGHMSVGNGAVPTTTEVLNVYKAQSDYAQGLTGTNSLIDVTPTSAYTNTTYGTYSNVRYNGAQNASQYLIGGSFNANHGGTGTINLPIGVGGAVNNSSTGTITQGRAVIGRITNAGTGAITSAQGGEFSIYSTGAGTMSNASAVDATLYMTNGAITNYYGFYANLPTITAPATVTNLYGIYLKNQTGATSNNYAIYSEGGQSYHAGNFGIGTASPQYKLDVTGSALFRNGNSAGVYTGGFQNLFGWNSSNTYMHGIRTRHNSGGPLENTMDFYVWRFGDAASVAGGQHVLTMQANNNGSVGIGTLNPSYKLDINGTNPLRLVGLQAGATTDSILTSNAGVVRRIAAGQLVTATTNTLSLSGNTMTSTVNGVAATSNTVSTVANTSSANNLTTTVNGVAATPVTIINSASNTSTGNTLTTTVNGVATTPVNIINSNATSLSGSSLTTTVNGVASTPLDLSPVVGLSAWRLLGNTGTNPTTNFLGTTDNFGLAFRTNNLERVRIDASGNLGIGITVPTQKLEILNGNILLNNSGTAGELRFAEPSASGTNYSAFRAQAQTVDVTYTLPSGAGVTGQQLTTDGVGNLSWTNAAGTTTNTLSLSGNTLTSTVNGVAATSNTVSTVANTSSANNLTTTVNGVAAAPVTIINSASNTSTGNTLTTTVNGVATTPVNIINSNATSLSGSSLTTTVNGVASTPLDLSPVVGLSAWRLLGNSGTVDGTNFLGTTDNVPFNIRVNNLNSGRIATDGSINSFGYQAGLTSSATFGNSYFGNQAGKVTTGNNNTFMGYNAAVVNTTGSNNSFFGTNVGAANTSGIDNTFLGYKAGTNNTTGQTNTYVGSQAGELNTTGSRNTYIGFESGKQSTVSADNTFLGYQTGWSTTTGINNIFTGKHAGYYNVTGSNNFFLGIDAGKFSTVSNNHFVGYQAGFSNTTGTRNTSQGYQAGYTNTTGSNNTFLGYAADATSATLNNAAAIGYNAKVATNNSMVLGGTGADAVNIGIGTTSPTSKLHIIGVDNLADTEISTTLANNATQGVAIKYGGIAKSGSNAVSSLDINAKGSGNIVMHASASGATTSTGNVGIGTASPAVTLDMGTRTDAVLMPRGTSAERPATPQTGMLRYNSSLGRMEYWNGTAWVIL